MKGTTEAMVKVLETTSSPVTTAGYLTFASGTGNYLDDIVVLKLNGDTVETETQVYNAANELTSQVVKGVTVSYAYDQFGRLTQKSKTGSRVANFYYNYGDKLTKVSSNFQGEGTVTYTYSGDQKRRSRSVSGGATTKYRFDHGWNVVNEEDGTGALQLTYIEGMATSAGSTASSGTWSYYSKDVIGSTRGLWDEDGDRLGKYDYTPFGGNYSSAGQGITRKYTGHDWDSTARLYHTAYRNYSPDMGRWISRDPLGMVDGPNVYAYVVNNPVSMFDMTGQYAVAIESVGVSGIASMLAGFASNMLYWIGYVGSAVAAGYAGTQVLEMSKNKNREGNGHRKNNTGDHGRRLARENPRKGPNEKCGEWAKRIMALGKAVTGKLKESQFQKMCQDGIDSKGDLWNTPGTNHVGMTVDMDSILDENIFYYGDTDGSSSDCESSG